MGYDCWSLATGRPQGMARATCWPPVVKTECTPQEPGPAPTARWDWDPLIFQEQVPAIAGVPGGVPATASAVRLVARSAGVRELWLDRATTQFRFLRPSSFNTALHLVLRPHFLMHFV
jgi:hypothetical protein